MRLLAIVALFTHTVSAAADTFVYVSEARDRQIVAYRMDPKDGTLQRSAALPIDGEPGALAMDPRHRFLFASIRSEGKLASFRIDAPTGKLTPVTTVPAGPDPAQLSTDARGRFLYCAYYVAGKVTTHAISPDGALSLKPLQEIATAEKAHAIVLDRANRFAFVPHTAQNTIFQFAFAADTGLLTPAAVPRLATPERTGPRHLVFHVAKPIAYVVNEQGSSVTAYHLDSQAGTLRPFQTVSTLPSDFRGTNACAEIRLHPSGHYLYVSNRGHDSIACFRVNAVDGTLSATGHAATEKTPRSFDLDPEGHFLYAAGEASNKLAAYRVQQDTGALDRFTTYDVGRQPWWVLAVRLP
jgi:6-phosphogluconolactonase